MDDLGRALCGVVLGVGLDIARLPRAAHLRVRVRGTVRVRVRVRVRVSVRVRVRARVRVRVSPAPLTSTRSFLGGGPGCAAYSRCLSTRSHWGSTTATRGRKTVRIRGAPTWTPSSCTAGVLSGEVVAGSTPPRDRWRSSACCRFEPRPGEGIG